MSLNAIAVNQETGTSKGVTETPAKIVTDGKPDTETWLTSEFAAEGKVKTGIWVGQQGTITISGYPSDEVFTVLEGRIEMTNEDGTVVSVGPGESALIPKGWKGLFRMVETTRKCFVTVG